MTSVEETVEAMEKASEEIDAACDEMTKALEKVNLFFEEFNKVTEELEKEAAARKRKELAEFMMEIAETDEECLKWIWNFLKDLKFSYYISSTILLSFLKNEDGYIDWDEMLASVKEDAESAEELKAAVETVKEIVEAVDTDGDGKMSKAEFKAFARKWYSKQLAEPSLFSNNEVIP